MTCSHASWSPLLTANLPVFSASECVRVQAALNGHRQPGRRLPRHLPYNFAHCVAVRKHFEELQQGRFPLLVGRRAATVHAHGVTWSKAVPLFTPMQITHPRVTRNRNRLIGEERRASAVAICATSSWAPVLYSKPTPFLWNKPALHMPTRAATESVS